jgi:hypothetical protein
MRIAAHILEFLGEVPRIAQVRALHQPVAREENMLRHDTIADHVGALLPAHAGSIRRIVELDRELALWYERQCLVKLGRGL